MYSNFRIALLPLLLKENPLGTLEPIGTLTSTHGSPDSRQIEQKMREFQEKERKEFPRHG